MIAMTRMFKCKRCGKVFGTKQNLISHLMRKTPCEAKEENTSTDELLVELGKTPATSKEWRCPGCDKVFGFSQSLYAHKARCATLRVKGEMFAEVESLKALLREKDKEILELRSCLMEKLQSYKIIKIA